VTDLSWPEAFTIVGVACAIAAVFAVAYVTKKFGSFFNNIDRHQEEIRDDIAERRESIRAGARRTERRFKP